MTMLNKTRQARLDKFFYDTAYCRLCGHKIGMALRVKDPKFSVTKVEPIQRWLHRMCQEVDHGN
jgi:DNA-directed RNA polymerase subunit RPC12/RpoP